MSAAHFPILLNRIQELGGVELALNAMTLQDEVSNDSELTFKAISAGYEQYGLPGASKALFISVMAHLVMVGNPGELRLEWAAERFSVDQEKGTVSAHVAVVGHSEFMDADPIESAYDIEVIMQKMGVDVKGESLIQIAGMPEPKPHEFISPSRLWTGRALFVSLMLAAYDKGPLNEVELYWRSLPKVEQKVARKVWVGTANALIVPQKRILV